MDSTKLDKLIKALTKEIKEDLEYKVKRLEKDYEAEYNKLDGHMAEIMFHLRDWKGSVEATLEDTDPTMFPIAKIQWEAKLEVINYMDSVLERELGKFGYVSIFKTEEEVE